MTEVSPEGAARADAAFERGLALHRAGDPGEAERAYAEALTANAGHTIAWLNRGAALRALGRRTEAVACYDRALELRPDYAEAWSNRGNVLLDLGAADAALESFRRASALKPDLSQAWSNQALALIRLGRWSEALEACDRATGLDPASAAAHHHRGKALHGLERFDAARAAHDQALALDPGNAEAWYDRGLACSGLRDFSEAGASYAAAIRLRPDYADAQWNRALCLLTLGELREGFSLYESRWRRDRHRRHWPAYPQPVWLGAAPLAGKTLLLDDEQGLGDTLQFCRYAQAALAQGARVLIKAQAPLVPLLRSMDGVSGVAATVAELPQFDLFCPMMSLPFAFGTDLASIPWSGPYLTADPGLTAQWSARLGQRRAPRIGLVWSGNPAQQKNRERSLGLARMLAALPAGYDYVSLQKSVSAEEREALAARPDIIHAGDGLTDFAHTAAVCALMDLVITVDTSVAHLCGALGCPTWILLAHSADWRWLLDREDCPWYPSARLLRQPSDGDWPSVMARVAAQIPATLGPP